MISKFPNMIAHSSKTMIARGECSFIIDTSTREEGSRSVRYRVRPRSRDERRALTIAARRDWNWESSGQPRGRAPSWKSKYRTRKSIPAQNICCQRVTRVTRSFRRNNEVSPGKNWVARVLFFSSLSIDTFISDHTQSRYRRISTNSASAKEIPSTSKHIARRLAWAYLSPREYKLTLRNSDPPGYSAMTTRSTSATPCECRAADCVTRKIFITLIKVYHNDACNVYLRCGVIVHAETFVRRGRTSGVLLELFEIAVQLVQFQWKKLRAHELDVIRIYIRCPQNCEAPSHIFPIFRLDIFRLS